MTTENTKTPAIEQDREDVTALVAELTASSGARAVSAWQALCEVDASYALDDEEAPYELRSAVGTDIGWEAAQDGLDPNGDIPRYVAYMRLHARYGIDWPENALRRHFHVEKGMHLFDAGKAAQVIWNLAVERYEDVRDSLPREEENELAEAAA